MSEHGKIISGENSYLRWSVVRYPMKGEDCCGDSYLVKSIGEKTLVVVTDGLGHGEQAFEASRKAIGILSSYSGQSLISLVKECHVQLRHTRGVVMNIALFDNRDHTVTWMGIGNIEGILFRADNMEQERTDNIVSRGGVVGYRLPRLKASITSITQGDTLVFSTDGVDISYENGLEASWSPERIVQYAASGFITGMDDALILSAHYKEREQ